MMAVAPHIENFKKRYSALSRRDQLAVMVLGLFLFGLFLWVGIWQTLERARDVSVANYQAASADLAWMKLHINEVKTVPAVTSLATGDHGSFLTTVTDTATIYQITVNRVEPSEDGTLRLVVDNVAISRLLSWLELLQRDHHVKARNATLEKVINAPGVVNVLLVLRQDI